MPSTRVRIACLCWSLSLGLWSAVADGRSPGSVTAEDVAPLLGSPLIAPTTTVAELKRFVRRRLPKWEADSAEPWERRSSALRARMLREVVLRGEAAEWDSADEQCRVEWLESVDVDGAYRIRKLRYEALPGLWIPALLYEPMEIKGRAPVVLNVNGHDSKGKAAAYKQIRCINQVRRGMLALNVEWLGMGQLRGDGFGHYRMNQLDLCGTSGLAPFYLSMRRGLDLLLAHPRADASRVAVAGLSGGGWQTIYISALDPRVTLANPVAGYSSFFTRLDYPSDLGDSEQTPCDMATVADYSHLTALLAPRAALLTYNVKDNCCFASAHALPPLLAAAEPVYQRLGAAKRLRSHVNHDPGTHNFERDNREALYGMFRDFFFEGEGSAEELECAGEVRSAELLQVPLPPDNLNFQLLALRAAKGLPQGDWPLGKALPTRAAAESWQRSRRKEVAAVVRMPHYVGEQVVAKQAAASQDASRRLVGVSRWRLSLGDDWTAPVVILSPPRGVAPAAGVTLVLSDEGRASAGVSQHVATLLQEGRRVAVWDPFYFGECKVAGRDFLYALLVATVGERPLGVQAGQFNAVVGWLRERHEGPVAACCLGRRASLIGLVATALHSDGAERLELHGSLGSLNQVIEENLGVNQAPELFCFGLLKVADIRQLAAMVAPREVVFRSPDPRVRRELAPLRSWGTIWGKSIPDPLGEAP